MQEGVDRPLNRDRVSVLLAVLVLGSILFRFIELPEQVYRLQALGSPLEIHASGTLLLITLTVGLACTGTSLIVHDHPHLVEKTGRPVYIAWILPAVQAGLSAYLLSLAPTLPIWVGGLIVFAIGMGLTVAAEYTTVSPGAPGYPAARLTLNVLAYLMAFVLFVLIYQTRSRSLVTATMTLLTAAVLALDLLSVADVQVGRILPFAGIIGLIIGESTWALNYWLVSAWVGGLLLLLIFYLAINIAHQHLLERLSASALVEFSAVTVAVLLVVLVSGS
ncbi:MAG: hypothetical protein PVF54_05490 [Anaerolineae bacterium]|jgi:hypothetical protein